MKVRIPPRLARLYRTAQLYGSGHLVRRHLELGGDEPVPLVIPHGVDTEVSQLPMDIADLAPVYLAWQERVARRAEAYKPVLRFPHPFLFIIPEHPEPGGEGTLFLSPPPSAQAFESLYTAIMKGDYPRPWAILVKERRVRNDDFKWWQARGFATHTAGDMFNQTFYYNLRDSITPYSVVATPNISSAAIFSLAMGKRVVPVPDVELTVVVTAPVDKVLDLEDSEGEIRRIWLNLFSEDAQVARRQALELLGQPFMASPRELRERYYKAIAHAKAPLYIDGVTSPAVVRVCGAIVAAGIPLHKAIPHPMRTLGKKLCYLAGINPLDVLRGSELGHYAIAGVPKPYLLCRYQARELGKHVQPGDALRLEELRGESFELAAVNYSMPKLHAAGEADLVSRAGSPSVSV